MKNKDYIIMPSFSTSPNKQDEIIISLKTIIRAIKQSNVDVDRGSLVIQLYNDYYMGYDPMGTSLVIRHEN
jgi:hypothetical protein